MKWRLLTLLGIALACAAGQGAEPDPDLRFLIKGLRARETTLVCLRGTLIEHILRSADGVRRDREEWQSFLGRAPGTGTYPIAMENPEAATALRFAASHGLYRGEALTLIPGPSQFRSVRTSPSARELRPGTLDITVIDGEHETRYQPYDQTAQILPQGRWTEVSASPLLCEPLMLGNSAKGYGAFLATALVALGTPADRFPGLVDEASAEHPNPHIKSVRLDAKENIDGVDCNTVELVVQTDQPFIRTVARYSFAESCGFALVRRLVTNRYADAKYDVEEQDSAKGLHEVAKGLWLPAAVVRERTAISDGAARHTFRRTILRVQDVSLEKPPAEQFLITLPIGTLVQDLELQSIYWVGGVNQTVIQRVKLADKDFSLEGEPQAGATK
jgi:hypothetical protein